MIEGEENFLARLRAEEDEEAGECARGEREVDNLAAPPTAALFPAKPMRAKAGNSISLSVPPIKIEHAQGERPL